MRGQREQHSANGLAVAKMGPSAECTVSPGVDADVSVTHHDIVSHSEDMQGTNRGCRAAIGHLRPMAG